MSPLMAARDELLIWIWSPKTTIVPFGALMPVWLSRLMLLLVMLLFESTAAANAVFTKFVSAGGAVAGGARMVPLPKLFTWPKLMTPPWLNPSELINAPIKSVWVLPTMAILPPLVTLPIESTIPLIVVWPAVETIVIIPPLIPFAEI